MKYLAEISLVDFRRAVEDYSEVVWNYAYILTRDRHLADEIAQDSFVKAYRSFQTFRAEASMKTWLLKITRNTWLTYRRSAFIRKVVLAPFLPDTSSVPSAENQYMNKIAASEMWEIVLQLPAKYREILLLHAHHQLDLQEIAESLGISESACKTRLRRAKQMALKIMNEKGDS
ncbi:RNA polymerase sigma factor [Paenibacillus glycanilyticus]|uniref:RNA polymerase sigma factor n=1 Tax=Paenibacillus glycanilyticus TaxID=126569 RepID=UPI00203BB28E|nr:RNA polymerase sigma factor [Paenibacillus glycanilyticus]MCM3625758.1 RNA polymerase sigma factor [Paenibacillus glycanilyticus]